MHHRGHRGDILACTRRWAAAGLWAVLAAAAPFAASAAAQTTSPAAAPSDTTPKTPVPIDVAGADRIEYDAATESYVFTGAHVVVTRGDQRLEAPEIRYDGARRRAVLADHGTLSAPTMGLEADAITADLGARHAVADGHVHGRFLDGGVWATVAAGHVEADDRPELRRVEAQGDAVIVRGDEELRGGRIVYDRTTQRGSADGDAVAVRGGDRLQADHIDGDFAARAGEAAGHVVLDRAATHMHGTADRAAYSGADDTVVLTGHAVVTRDRDRMEADRITVHLRENRAVADGHPKITAYPSSGAP
jgi:lipopolysaccharide transport protein LptA